MRFTAPIVAALATTAIAAPLSIKRADDPATTLATALTDVIGDALSVLELYYDEYESGLGIQASDVTTLLSNVENNVVEGITLFKNILSEISDSDSLATLGQYAIEAQEAATSTAGNVTAAQTALSTDTIDSPISVSSIDELLDTLITPVSDVVNELADALESLDLPSLPVL